MIFLIYPHQLFESITFLKSFDFVYILEHPFFFEAYKYHKLKLIFHRASLQYYASYLEDHDIPFEYIPFYDYPKKIKTILKQKKEVGVYDLVDYDLRQELIDYDIRVTFYESPNFLCSSKDLQEYYDSLKNKDKFQHSSFYIYFRKKMNILCTKDKKPFGNKWSFDKDNRKPFPIDIKESLQVQSNKSSFVKEAKEYIEEHFPNNFGDTDFYLPIEYPKIKKHVQTFFQKRIKYFGVYEDAMNPKIMFAYHSVFSLFFNTGMILPKVILKKCIHHYQKYPKNLQNIEAYIRQLFWREYMRFCYLYKHKEMTSQNFFNHTKKLPQSWYSSIEFPILKDLFEKIRKYAYLHHIERLMFFGNFMLLSEFHPHDVYTWFMTMFIDACLPWVMIGNIYGMSQFSCSDKIMKRPYFSSSNYISNMSRIKRKPNLYPTINGKEWYEIWDEMYKNFILKNQKYLLTNYATASIVRFYLRQKSKS